MLKWECGREAECRHCEVALVSEFEKLVAEVVLKMLLDGSFITAVDLIGMFLCLTRD